MNLPYYAPPDFEDNGDKFWDADAARAERVANITAGIVSDCIKGKCDDFWLYDGEIIQASVRRSFAAIGLTDAERWKVLERDVLTEIAKYAKEVAEDRC